MKRGPQSWLMQDVMAFDKPVATANGYGGVTTGWAEQFCAHAEIVYLRGGEAVQAARLAGLQPVVVKVRSTDGVKEITPEWRMRDTRRGTVYQIRAVVPMENRRFHEITGESGVAV